MALYLNNLDLNGNQLIKAVVHPLGTAPSTAQEGQIYYDTGDNVVYVNTSTNVNSPTWVNMQSGDLTGISITTDSGSGAPASDTSGSADFSILGTSGVGVTNSGATITVTSVPSEIDHDSLSNFASNEHFTQASITTVGTIDTGVWNGTAIATSYIADDAVTEDKLANTLLAEIDANTVKATNATHTGDVTGSGSLTIATAAVTMAKLANIATDTFIGRTAASAGVPKALSKAEALAILNVADGANVNVAPTTAQVKTALNAAIGSNALTVGDSDTVTTVPGDLTISGDITISGGVTLESTTNTAIRDKILLLNQGATGANTSDLAVLWSRGYGTTSGESNIALKWDESSLEFQLICTGATGAEATGAIEPLEGSTLGTSGFQALRAGKFLGPLTGNVTGDASGSSATVTSIGNLSGDVTSSNRTTTIGAGKVHHGMLAEDIISGQGSITTLTQTDLLAVHDTSASIVKQISLTNFEDQIFANINTASSEVSVAAGGAITIADNTADTSGNAATATKIASITNSNIVQLAGAQTLTGTKTLNSFKGTGSVTVTNILDADDMSGASATTLATSESIKAYVDAQGSSASNTGGRQAFVLNSTTTGVAATSTTVFTITHGMGSSRNYGVEIIRNSANSGGGETVIVDVARPTDTTITVTFAAAPTAGDYTALVCKY